MCVQFNGILCTYSGGINITFIGTLLDVVEDPTMKVNIINDTSGTIISNHTTVSVCYNYSHVVERLLFECQI